MSKLARLRGKKGERFKDLPEEKQKEIFMKLGKGIQNMGDYLKETTNNIVKHEAEKSAQPFKTNYLLEDIKKNQTPLWIGIAILIISFITMIIATISLFK